MYSVYEAETYASERRAELMREAARQRLIREALGDTPARPVSARRPTSAIRSLARAPALLLKILFFYL